MTKISSDLIRGHIDTIILKLLQGGDKYGYDISKSISSASGGKYELNEATMYSSLKRLEQNSHVESYWGDESMGGRRKYYRITGQGKKTYTESKKNWEFAKQIIDKLI